MNGISAPVEGTPESSLAPSPTRAAGSALGGALSRHRVHWHLDHSLPAPRTGRNECLRFSARPELFCYSGPNGLRQRAKVPTASPHPEPSPPLTASLWAQF